MPTGSSLNIMMKEMPERTFDVGIAEQHAVTFFCRASCPGYDPLLPEGTRERGRGGASGVGGVGGAGQSPAPRAGRWMPVDWKAMNGNLFDGGRRARTGGRRVVHGALRWRVEGKSWPGRGDGAVVEDGEGRIVARLSEYLGGRRTTMPSTKGCWRCWSGRSLMGRGG